MKMSRTSRPRRTVPWVALIALALAGAACEQLTSPGPETAVSFILSDPTTAAVATSNALAADADGTATTVAYVSLPPGTVAGGASATLFNATTLAGASTAMVDGGFDPVALGASPGDTIEITIWTGQGVEPATIKHEVPVKRRPVVVRTSPPRGKRDVVLNSVLVVVFSEPLAGGSVSTETLRLLRGESPVPGTVEVGEDGLTIRFRPDASLGANTAYTLEVSTGITDLDGDALEAPVRVGFRTGAVASAVASMSLAPNPLRSVPADFGPWGYTVPLRATLLDAAGNEVTGTDYLQWRSDDTTVVGFSAWRSTYVGLEEVVADVGWRAGEAVISASVGGVSASTSVLVEDVAFGAVTVGVNGFACYLAETGRAYCTGSNSLGQLGIGFANYAASSPIAVAGDLVFETISSGWDHACGVTSEGYAYCWGHNHSGKLGDGTLVPGRPAPVAVAGPRFEQIGAGWSHTCGLTAAGQAYCWGRYGWVEPPMDLGPAPVAVPGNVAFASLAVGGRHACGLDAGGNAYCWGENGGGALGDGTFQSTVSPVAVHGGHTFKALGAGAHTCGVTTEGEAYCWGSGDAGTSETGAVMAPRRVDLPVGVALETITAGHMLTCGLTADGAAYCWGWTWPCTTCDEVAIPPRRVHDVAFRSLDAGEADLVCGVTVDGAVRCWRAVELVP